MFSVSAQDFMLFQDHRFKNGLVVKEYSVDVDSNHLALKFIPGNDSFSFISALEVFPAPKEATPEDASVVEMAPKRQTLRGLILETVLRVNMGNVSVGPGDDPLRRNWVADGEFLKHSGVLTLSRIQDVKGTPSQGIAPRSVYGTATMLDSSHDPHLHANLTWNFTVDPGFEFLIRFHFCDIVDPPPESLFFNVYVNSWYAYQNLDLGKLTSEVRGSPYYLDVIATSRGSGLLTVSVGPYADSDIYSTAFLNGLEVMKIHSVTSRLFILAGQRSKWKTVMVISSAVSILSCLVLFLAIYLFYSRRHSKHVCPGKSKGERCSFSDLKSGYRYPLMAIKEATDNFSEDLAVGGGEFGKVYKGVLRDGTRVTVKRLCQSLQREEEFRTEIEMLSHLRHRHLISLVGYCDEQHEMIIVYEFMEKGPLKNHLYGSSLPSLCWKKRLEICIGSAKGLHYLHTGSSKAIIHRDVRSENVLLDQNFMAKLADFGASRTGPEIDQSHVSTAVKGSFGYLDPEYLRSQHLTEKSDIYSFGVMMLEILAGRPVIDPSLPKDQLNLVEWAMHLKNKDQEHEVVDPRLLGQVGDQILCNYMDIASKCLAKSGINRPSMGTVLRNLELVLHLQVQEDNPVRNEEPSPQIDHKGLSATDVPSVQFSMGSIGDFNETSISKVFAKMVRREFRQI
ncbi:hypothetical protein MLD38_003700 [Melastoma candidum]|nr:hypothetical protein MLD38_003700 [Melastoma candidum]